MSKPIPATLRWQLHSLMHSNISAMERSQVMNQIDGIYRRDPQGSDVPMSVNNNFLPSTINNENDRPTMGSELLQLNDGGDH